MMADDDSWDAAVVPRRSETLWCEPRGNSVYRCDLVWLDKAHGWEVRLFKDADALITKGGFRMRWEAVRWACLDRPGVHEAADAAAVRRHRARR